MTDWRLPVNFSRLWSAQPELLAWAEGVVAQEAYLQEHVELIEAYMDAVEAMRQSRQSGDRYVALAGLFLRTFDSLSHALRASFSGNYSGCAMYARDLFETTFLVDYLMDEAGRPEQWLNSNLETVRKKFHPAKIRKALDKRDGFETMKRKAHYDALSALGAHPTPVALDLKRDGTRAINSGPFKQRELLTSCIEELAIASLLLGSKLLDFCKSDVPDGAGRSSRLAIVLQRNREKYFPKQEV